MTDETVARISGRLEARRVELRQHLEARPELHDLAAAIRSTWNQTDTRNWERLVWFRFGGETFGHAEPGPPGVPISPPPPNALMRKRRKPDAQV